MEMNLEKNIYVYNRITLLYTWNIVNQLLESVCVLMDQLCLTLWDLMDCSLPGSSVHGILQARKLEWVAIPFSRGSSWPGMEPRSPALQEDYHLSHQERVTVDTKFHLYEVLGGASGNS